MLRRTFIASAVLFATAAAAPAAFAFTEGKDADYITLEKPLPGGEGKLVKVWSYDCPFCFKFDVGVDPKMVPLAEKATGLKFDMVHIETKGKYGRAGSELFAWCQLRDKAAGITDWEDPKSIFKKAKDAIYKAYHRQGERWPPAKRPSSRPVLMRSAPRLKNSPPPARRLKFSSSLTAGSPATTSPRFRAFRPMSSTASTSS